MKPLILFIYISLCLIFSLAFFHKTFGDDCGEFMSCGGIPQKTIVIGEHREWTKEMQAQWEHDEMMIKKFKEQALEQTKQPKVVLSTKQVVKPQEQPLKCKSDRRVDLVNHAYKISGGDMKFVGTIASESMYDVNSNGDGGHSWGLCQFHQHYQPDNVKAYKALKTDFEKLEFCYSKYKIWKDKGQLSTRLYGSNVWRNGLNKLHISCNS